MMQLYCTAYFNLIFTKKGTESRQFLLAFDFDNSLVNHSDCARVICTQSLFKNGVLPPELEQLRRQQGWDKFLIESFRVLAQQGKVIFIYMFQIDFQEIMRNCPQCQGNFLSGCRQ